MLIVETIGRIRREHLIKGKSIKEIARDLKISRNTVRKVLRSGETSFSYEREIQPRPKLGRWKAELDRMLTANTSNPARERLTLIRLFEELRALGYEGGYDAVRRYARSWSREHASQMADAYVPLTFAPGEAYQFDWSHEIVVMNGVTTIVKVKRHHQPQQGCHTVHVGFNDSCTRREATTARKAPLGLYNNAFNRVRHEARTRRRIDGCNTQCSSVC